MGKIVTFGEIMLRLNPQGYLKFIQANSFDASYAGGEANVAVSLANYGHDVAFCTKVPAHDIGQCAVNALRRFGVDTGTMLRGGERLGVYFVEKGASQRASKVIYDRANSAIAQATREEFQWEQILANASWFHWTGITPSLSKTLPDIIMDAMRVCHKKGITVSCDLNYRNKLWSRETANQVMSKLVPYVDVLIANEEDAADIFGIVAADADIVKGKLEQENYSSVAKQLVKRFGCKSQLQNGFSGTP